MLHGSGAAGLCVPAWGRWQREALPWPTASVLAHPLGRLCTAKDKYLLHRLANICEFQHIMGLKMGGLMQASGS